MIRQGIIVSAEELRKLADQIDKDWDELDVIIKNKTKKKYRKMQLNIINKYPDSSDTWEFEDDRL